MVFDGNLAETNRVQLYVNTEIGGISRDVGTLGTTTGNSAQEVIIGAGHVAGDPTTPNNQYNGIEDEIRIMDIACSFPWIETDYNNTKYPSLFISVGTEIDQYNNIALGANKYGMLRKDVTAAQTFSTIASGFSHDVCFTWWNSTGDNWESYWVGDSYNSAVSVPQNDSYFVLMDGTGEAVSCSIATAGTVAIPIGWSCTYLRESTSKTLTAIKSDMGGNCVDLYAWNHTASGTGAWTDTGAYSVLPNQGLLVNASTGFNWDGAVP